MPKIVPALFPTLFGAVALAILWQYHGAPVVGWLMICLWIIATTSYLTRVAIDPSIISRDLDTLPGRTGLTAMNLTLMLVAGLVGTRWLLLGQIALIAALLIQCALVFAVGRRILRADATGKMVQPVWQMVFTGFVVAIPAAAGVGSLPLAQTLLGVSVVMALAIWGLTAAMFAQNRFPPPQLRPTLAIHLSPAAMIGIGGIACGYPMIGTVFFGISVAIFVALVIKMGWLTAHGFSPFWGSFTFPFVAFASLSFFVTPWLGWLLLCIATLLITMIAVRILRMWGDGVLGTMTFAA